MKLKLLALTGIMAASMGLTACDSNKENAAEDLSDAQENVQDASEELNDADAGVPTADAETAVADAESAIADAQVATGTDEMDAEVPVDSTTTNLDMANDTDTDAANAADEVVVIEGEPAQ
ncbi:MULTISPECIES: hypothetical protein [Psychrobacter]|uniref:hypothetical protein n=1 Tax=Psychrobacter TaxID=497 RepID=UPI00191B25A0|nr:MULTISPECIES: hypothetical protein [Psychrobacter]